MIWRALFNPQFGVANEILGWVGLSPQQWLLEPRGVLCLMTGGYIPPGVGPSLALCCIIVFEIWHASGFMIVIFLAGLTAIPRELEESARIDGANALQVIRNVILPLLSPTIFFLAIVSVIKSFQAFNSFYALTGNGRGPVDSTQNVTVYIYSSFYEYQRLGYGAAVATLLCLAIVTLTLLQWRFVGRRVHYE
jgi:multiple sugar transport system permease protein